MLSKAKTYFIKQCSLYLESNVVFNIMCSYKEQSRYAEHIYAVCTWPTVICTL